MSFWTAMVVIVAILSFVSLRIAKYRALGHRENAPTLRGAPREAELEREVLDLKKRLAVLERIATDDRQSSAIAKEIESLRDR